MYIWEPGAGCLGARRWLPGSPALVAWEPPALVAGEPGVGKEWLVPKAAKIEGTPSGDGPIASSLN